MEPNVNLNSNNDQNLNDSDDINIDCNEFFERPFEEVPDGFYDDRNFYVTPNGSFWDETGKYFNRDGFDKHHGRYDKYGVYIPGPNFNQEYYCYEDELDKDKKNDNILQDVLNDEERTLIPYINNAQEDIMELEKYDEDDAEFKKMDLDQKMLEEAYEEGYKVYLESKRQNNINNPSKNNQNECNAAKVNGNTPTAHNYCENIIPNH
jgi:hypothetical protein